MDWEQVRETIENEMMDEPRRDPVNEAYMRHEKKIIGRIKQLMRRGFPPHHLRRYDAWDRDPMETYIYHKSGATYCLPPALVEGREVWYVPDHADDVNHIDVEAGVIDGQGVGLRQYFVWFYNDNSPNAKLVHSRNLVLRD